MTEIYPSDDFAFFHREVMGDVDFGIPRTFFQWDCLGYTPEKGSKSVLRDKFNVPLFTWDQVWKTVDCAWPGYNPWEDS